MGKKAAILKSFKLSIPIAVQGALGSILSFLDIWMVNGLGVAAMAAIGVVARWHFAIIMIVAALGTTNSVLISQFWGKGDVASCKQKMVQALILGLALTVLTTIAIYVFRTPLLHLSSDDPNVIAFGEQYLLYSLPIFVFTIIVIVFESSYRASDDTFTPLFLSLVAIVTNIILNYALILGHFGAPAMGVVGAALATSISRLVHALLFFAHILYKRHWIWTQKYAAITVKNWKTFFKFVVPVSVNTMFWGGGSLAYMLIIGSLGTDALSIYSLLVPLEGLIFSWFYGFSVGCSVMVGQYLGQSDYSRASNVAQKYIIYAPVVCVFVMLCLWLGRDTVLSFFHFNSAELLRDGEMLLMVMCSLFWLKTLNVIIITGVLRTGGDNNFCFKADMIAMWGIGIPLTAFAAMKLELSIVWVYVCLYAEEVSKLILISHRYIRGGWKNNITEEHAAEPVELSNAN